MDWKKVWEKVKPILLQLLIAALSGGAGGLTVHECSKPAIERAVQAQFAAQK